MLRIALQAPGGPSVSCAFERDRLRIGGSEDNDLVVRDPAVSPVHAEILHGPGGWIVLDLGSGNGTSLNDRPITGPVPLRPGDRIRIGAALLVFEGTAPTARGALPDASLPAEEPPGSPSAARGPTGDAHEALAAEILHQRIVHGPGSFWTIVHDPFLARDLSRGEVRALVRHALRECGGSYRRVAAFYRISGEYRRFLHFLWNHDLRVERPAPRALGRSSAR